MTDRLMARPIRPDSHGVKHWNYIIVIMGRMKSSALIDTLCEPELAKATVALTDQMVALATRHKEQLVKQGRGEDPPAKPRKKKSVG
jgi:hypothetical protein